VLIWILDLKKEDKKEEDLMDSKEERILEKMKMLKDQKNTTLNLVKDIKKGITVIDPEIIIIPEAIDNIITIGDNIMEIDQKKPDSTTIEDNIIMDKGTTRNKDKKKTKEP
jgi:hypothetical protein